jgi:hypothetical protein
VIDYKLYPVADNQSPRLSADRLEYTISNGFFSGPEWTRDQMERLYGDISVLKNENGVDELGFNTPELAEEFVLTASKIWPCWINNKLAMNLIADIVKISVEEGLFTVDDLYILSEKEVLDLMKNSGIKKIADAWTNLENTTDTLESDEPVAGKYCKSLDVKKRYIDPLVMTENGVKPTSEISAPARKEIDDFLNHQDKKYAYFDFDF